MPDIEIVKLKLRRGTNSQRQSVVFEQGELGYTTDSKRVFVGDGFLSGGSVVGAKVHDPVTIGDRSAVTTAIPGDLVVDNNLMYQLTGTDATTLSAWRFVGTKVDETSLEYDAGVLEIKDNGITIDKVSSDFVYASGGLEITTSGLSAKVDNSTITINADGELESSRVNISASDIGNGLSGGSGDPIGVDTTSSFTFVGGKLEILSIPTDSVVADSVNASALGNGLEKTPGTGEVRLEVIGGGVMNPFNSSEYDSTGRVISTTSTIEQNLSGTNTSGDGAIFFGSLDESNPANETVINALSANSAGTAVTINLSSAGFIQIASGDSGNFAIPVFKF